jgi:subtilisin family serine protease
MALKGTLHRLCMLLIALTMLAGAWTPAGADHGLVRDEIIVAVLDTGIRATHTEFDYVASGGNGNGPAGQLVAWWDFTNERAATQLPGAGQTWDSRFAPYDNHGHGTGVASLVGGATVSLAPGTNIAVAKIGTGSGALQNFQAAYDWALHTVQADIITMSFGGIVPTPGILFGMEGRFAQASQMNVLTLVAAGNGMANSCGPAVTWTHAFGLSQHVLAVGSLDSSGTPNPLITCSHLDPDIASHGVSVPQAGPQNDNHYRSASGTSFATPLVAGAAAEILATLLDEGETRDSARLKSLIMDCATQGLFPYTLVGFGFFHETQLDRAITAAKAGTTCDDPNPTSVSWVLRQHARLHHEHVVGAGRTVMNLP